MIQIRVYRLPTLAAAVLGLTLPLAAHAGAPGEDPITLEKKVTVQMMPINQARTTGSINYNLGTPAQIQAKINRYTAQAYSANTSGISTEKDVVQTVQTQGSKVVCSQSVGSNTGTSGLGGSGSAGGKVTSSGDQIVVIRGDMVNICN